MGNIAMPEVVLNRSGVVSVVRQLVAAGVPKHVGMSGEGQASFPPGSSDDLPDI
jgi:hypothetical protein